MVRWFRRTPKQPAHQEEQEETGNRVPVEKVAPEATAPCPDDQDTAREGPKLFQHMRQRLRKTRQKLLGGLDRLILGKKEIDEEILEELEEVLITADMGVSTTRKLIEAIEAKVHRRELTDPDRLLAHLKDEICHLLQVEAAELDVGQYKPFVLMAIGVNGVGKTTTLAKLGHYYKSRGMKVMLVAADTFRAAAVEQLEQWADRLAVDLVKQHSGADPGAVVFDALTAAQARGTDVVLIDTAGRLHTKVNLMEELKKVKRVIAKQMAAAPHEVLLILDATTGQNALSQARLFHQELGVTGLALTKLDGTAKGGIVIGICQELKLPIRFIGLGEALEDLQPFEAERFVAALF